MTKEQLDTEIAAIQKQIEDLSRTLVSAEGALQAFQYMKAKQEQEDAKALADAAEAAGVV